MEYGVFGIQGLLNSVVKQYDEFRAPFLRCNTRLELKEALKPHVIRILNSYKDVCYGSITMTSDRLRYDLYTLSQAVYHISKFGMKTIERAVDDIVREQ